MDVDKLIHDPAKIQAALKDVGGKLYTNTDMDIYFPKQYEAKNFAFISNDVNVMGYYIIVIGDSYGVSLVPGMINLSPDSINTVIIEGDECHKLHFPAKSMVISNTEIVMNNNYLFFIYDVFIARGNMPWFMKLRYQYILDIFKYGQYYTGTKLGHNTNIIHMVLTSIVRDVTNTGRFFRQTLNSRADMDKKFLTVPFRNISYTATNTVTRLIGSYMDDGINSALTDPTERVEVVEALLRE